MVLGTGRLQSLSQPRFWPESRVSRGMRSDRSVPPCPLDGEFYRKNACRAFTIRSLVRLAFAPGMGHTEAISATVLLEYEVSRRLARTGRPGENESSAYSK